MSLIVRKNLSKDKNKCLNQLDYNGKGRHANNSET